MAAHTLGMALILLDHPLGLLRLVLVVGGLGLAVLLGGVLLLTLHARDFEEAQPLKSSSNTIRKAMSWVDFFMTTLIWTQK